MPQFDAPEYLRDLRAQALIPLLFCLTERE
jgi:hypothetical protein